MVLSARRRQKAATVNGQIAASAPPQIMTSASPERTKRKASPIECAPVVQAVDTECIGPLK